MKKRLNFRIIILTAMLTFGALVVTKVTMYKKHHPYQFEHCEKNQTTADHINKTN